MLPAPGLGRNASATCSECGLGFTWVVLLNALRQLLPRFVEHARGRRETVTAIAWTWTWLVFPHRFWSRVTVERKVVLARAILWLMAVVVAMRLAEAAIVFLVYVWEATVSLRPIGAWWLIKKAALDAYNIRDLGGWGDPAPLGLVAGLLSLVSAAMLVILPITRRRAKIRLSLVLRAWIYSNALLAFVLLTNAVEIVASLAFSDMYNLGLGYGMDPSERVFRTVRASGFARAGVLPEIVAFMTLWQAWFWYSALKVGLRVPQAFVVTLALIVPAALATITVLVIRGLP
jgi:hypothetical protein